MPITQLPGVVKNTAAGPADHLSLPKRSFVWVGGFHTMYKEQDFLARCRVQSLANHVVNGRANSLEFPGTFAGRRQCAISLVVDQLTLRPPDSLSH